MTPYVVNIAASGASETLIQGKAGRTLVNAVINITNPGGGAYNATLTFTRGGKSSVWFSYSMKDGDEINRNTKFIFDPSTTLTFDGSPNLSIILTAEEA